MHGLKQRWFAVTGLACVLAVGGKSVKAFSARITGEDHKNTIHVLSLPLNSMDGLEVQGISDAGANPVKIQTEVTSYRGRRAVKLLMMTAPPEQGVAARLSQSSSRPTLKTARSRRR
jgi:hypothetical protein